MKKVLVIIFIIILSIGGLIYFKFMQGEKAKDYIETTGIVEATEVEMGSKISGRIVYLCCKEGDFIKAGTTAVRLDDKELKARVEEGSAALKQALASLKAGVANLENAKLEIDAVKSEMQSLDADIARMTVIAEDTRKNKERIMRLFKEDLVSQKEMDAADTNYDANYANLESIKARKGVSETKLKTAANNVKAAEANLSLSMARVKEKEATLNLLETQSRDTEIISPVDGVITYKSFETGEMVSPAAPVYTIHDLKNIWARVDVEETMIGMIRLGDKAKMKASAIPDKEFDGEVIEIGREGEFATQRDVTRGRSDIRTFRVKIGIKESNGLLKTGMTVKVKIKVQISPLIDSISGKSQN